MPFTCLKKILDAIPLLWLIRMMLFLFSCSIMPSSLWLHVLQHARLPTLTPRFCSDSCPLSWWCHSAVSSSVTPFYPCPPSFPASGLFKWLGSSHQVAIVLGLQHQSYNENSGLISFRIDWFDHLTFQGTLKSLLQHHSSKASNLWHSSSFMVQLSHPHMTTGKTIAFTIGTFVSKVIFVLFNTLSRFVIAFLPRIKHLLILWLPPLSAVIL